METQEKVGHLEKVSVNDTQTRREIPRETQPRVGHLERSEPAPATRRTDTVKGA